MKQENNRCNGYKNFETYLLLVNITNSRFLYDDVREYYKRNFDYGQDDKITNDDIDIFKGYLSSKLWIPEYNIYNIYDSWSTREWIKIDFKQILGYFRDE